MSTGSLREVHTQPDDIGNPPGASRSKLANAPFDKSNAGADVVVRSSDLVDFHLRKAILAEASEVFHGMFTLPELPANRKRKDRDETDYVGDIPVVYVEEDSTTIDHLMRFCYPVEKPQMKGSKETCLALAAARKYMIDGILTPLCAQFVTQAEEDPVRMYAYACKFDWHKEMRIAAKAYLRHPPVADGVGMEEMDYMTARQYLRLESYRQLCSSGASQILCNVTDGGGQVYEFGWVDRDEWVWTTYPHSHTGARFKFKYNYAKPAAEWFLHYIGMLQEKLKKCPRGETVLDPELSWPSIARAFEQCQGKKSGTCSCKKHIVPDLAAFNKLIAARVEETISKIALPD